MKRANTNGWRGATPLLALAFLVFLIGLLSAMGQASLQGWGQ